MKPYERVKEDKAYYLKFRKANISKIHHDEYIVWHWIRFGISFVYAKFDARKEVPTDLNYLENRVVNYAQYILVSSWTLFGTYVVFGFVHNGGILWKLRINSVR